MKAVMDPKNFPDPTYKPAAPAAWPIPGPGLGGYHGNHGAGAFGGKDMIPCPDNCRI